jgi:DNA-binding NarL/FixJ family response regulator
MHSPLKILLVDDHTMTRNGLSLAFADHKAYIVAGEAATGAKALEQVELLKPDLVLLDIHLPDISGIEVCRRILESHPGLRVLIFTSDVTRATVDKALRIGVSGYLSKASSVEELLQAIGAVMAGKLYFSAEASGDILKDYRESLRENAKDSDGLLSKHEKDLLRLVSQGLRNKEIASELEISSKSVEAYRSRLMKKLNCSSPAELVLYAVREGITRV